MSMSESMYMTSLDDIVYPMITSSSNLDASRFAVARIQYQKANDGFPCHPEELGEVVGK